ncbi:MAG: DUF917 domain-containing protein [Thermoplasmata archaeon]
MRKLSREEVFDMIDGATILGTGGGGDPSSAYTTLSKFLDDGKYPILAELDELEESQYIGSPYFVGSIAPTQGGKESIKFDYKLIERAIEMAKKLLHFDIKGIIASELGGGNTGLAVISSLVANIPLIDGDFMGRAGPELHQSTVNVCGKAMTPSIIITGSGNQLIMMSYQDIDSYESIVRHISVISGGHAAVLDSILRRDDAKNCYIKGTIQKCIDVGRARRKAVENLEDPVEAITKVLNGGKIIFSGVVKKYIWKDCGGFLKGIATLSGDGEYSGKTLESYIMNEHISIKIDGKYQVLPPDLISFLKPDTGEAISNTILKEGMHVKVITANADEKWKTKRGLELFGPEHFGNINNWTLC